MAEDVLDTRIPFLRRVIVTVERSCKTHALDAFEKGRRIGMQMGKQEVVPYMQMPGELQLTGQMSRTRSKEMVLGYVMPLRLPLLSNQTVIPVLLVLSRRKPFRSTPAEARRCSMKSPNTSRPITPMSPTFVPKAARLKAVIELDPPRTNLMSLASFSLPGSKLTLAPISRSTFASPIARQSSFLFMQTEALDDASNYSVRTRVIGIQPAMEAKMISEKLAEGDFKRNAQYVRKFGRNSGNTRLGVASDHIRRSDKHQPAEVLGSKLFHQIKLIYPLCRVTGQPADH